ncbi:MAG TPA: hypothetical protein VFW35_09435 [Sphingomicrobium sp.]|nr:hypothetical protein [Sphingomicrobium sp.]
MAHQREMFVAALLGAVAALVEATEEAERQADVVAVASDGCAVAARDRLGDSVDHLLPTFVVHRPPGHQRGGVPGGAEQRIARGERVRRLARQAGIIGGEGRLAGVGEHLEEKLARERRPAVAALLRRADPLDELGERVGVGAEAIGKGGEVVRGGRKA